MSTRRHFIVPGVLAVVLAWMPTFSTATATETATASAQEERSRVRIAFSRFDPQIDGFALWTVRADGSRERRVTEGQAYFPGSSQLKV